MLTQISNFFDLIDQKPSNSPRGIISPHAGYTFSGLAAAHSYNFIKKTKVRRFVIIGPNHTGIGPDISVYPPGVWETPLGDARVDEELSNKFKDFHDLSAHEYEHSIEVQIRFLQYIFNDFTFLPITVKTPKIEEVITRLPSDVILIASSDFTHYGPGYGFDPFKSNKREKVERLDMDAIDSILKLDVKGFLQHMIEYNDTICGYVPITILLKWLKKFKVVGKLLKFYTSGDIVGDYENFVAYAAIGFEDKKQKNKSKTNARN